MKRILFAALIFCAAQSLLAQSKAEENIKEEMWTNPPPEFKTTDVPEKWKNESAVVLALERKYVGDFAIRGIGKFYAEKLNLHFRIKLLDKAAVTDYSELSFNDKTVHTNMFGRASSYHIIGIKVIKPNGTGKEVDLSKGVKNDSGSDKDMKIPIPNLEPGDIIDYFVAIKDQSEAMPNFGDEVILEGKYPIVTSLVSFSIPHQFELYSKPYNGAPDLKKTTVKNDEIWSLRVEMQEKQPDLLWDYEYRTSPQVRFSIASSGEEFNARSRTDNLLRRFDMNTSDVGPIEDYINGNFKKEKDPKKITEEVFLLLRNPIYKKAYYSTPQDDPLNQYYASDLFFALVDKTLKRRHIGYEILLASSRTYGPMSSVVNFSPCDFLIKVNTNPPIYLQRPSPFTLPGDVPYYFEGMEAMTSVSQVAIPASTKEQNTNITTMKLSLDPADATKLKVERTNIAKGHTKLSHQYLVFTNYDYLKAYDQPKYQVESSRLLGGIIKDYNKEKKKLEQRMTQDYNERDEHLKQDIESSMDVKVSDYKFTLKNIGMWPDKPDTEYNDSFTLENITKKAGPNTILELGKLIEKQTELKPEQKTRTRDVHMDYARSFLQEMTFTIPEGYSIEGLEAFNKNVVNDAGGFVSSATVTGNTLTLKTNKFYNKNYYAAADWSKITPFLAAAAEFYNAKILLKH